MYRFPHVARYWSKIAKYTQLVFNASVGVAPTEFRKDGRTELLYEYCTRSKKRYTVKWCVRSYKLVPMESCTGFPISFPL